MFNHDCLFICTSVLNRSYEDTLGYYCSLTKTSGFLQFEEYKTELVGTTIRYTPIDQKTKRYLSKTENVCALARPGPYLVVSVAA